MNNELIKFLNDNFYNVEVVNRKQKIDGLMRQKSLKIKENFLRIYECFIFLTNTKHNILRKFWKTKSYF